MPKIELLNVRRCNEAAHSDNLAPDEVAVLENFVLDNPAWEHKPYIRGGFLLYQGWDDNTPIKRMQDAMDSTGQAVLLVSSGTSLDVIDDTLGTNSLITGANSNGTFHIAPLGEGVYAASNGYDRPSILSGSKLTTVRPLVLSSMDTQYVGMTRVSGGNLTANSYYRWIVVYVTASGEISEITYPLVINTDLGDDIVDGYTTDVTYKSVTFSYLPNSGDARVTGKRIYRTKPGGRVFYLAATLEPTVQTFTDSIPDTELDTGEALTFLGTPRSMKTMAFHKGRLFGGNFTKDYTNALMPPAKSNVRTKYATAPTIGLAIGTYQFAISYVDQDGRESQLSPYHVVNVTYADEQAFVTYPMMKVFIDGFPKPRIGAGELDKSIAAINFYRTKANQFDTYYFLKSVSPQAFVDDPRIFNCYEPDSSLMYTYPRKSKLSTDTVAFANGVAFSDINRPSMFPQENVVLVHPEEDDSITGILDDGDGVLVFKNNSISKVFTSGSPVNWRVVRISSVLGCTYPETLVQTDSAYYFMHEKEVWKYSSSGGFKLLSEPKKGTFLSLTAIKSACYWEDKKWLVITAQNLLGSVILCYDEKLDSWYHFTNKLWNMGGYNEDTVQSVCPKRYGINKGRLMVGTWNNVMYYNGGGSYDFSWSNNKDIESKLTSRTFTFGNGIGMARLRKVWVRYRINNCYIPIVQQFVKDITESVSSSHYRGGTGSLQSHGEVQRFEIDDWQPVGDLDTCLRPERVAYMIQGTIMIFMGVEISYNVINRGRRA